MSTARAAPGKVAEVCIQRVMSFGGGFCYMFLQISRGQGGEKGMFVSEKEKKWKRRKNEGALKGLSALKCSWDYQK